MFKQKRFGDSLPVKRLILIGVVMLIAILGYIVITRGNGGISGNTYQLVKLNNGESYIGRLSGLDREYATLNSPFIYQEPEGNAQGENAEIQLLRVSSIDGDLRIATDKIIYWGNLPKEGRVVNAIKSAE